MHAYHLHGAPSQLTKLIHMAVSQNGGAAADLPGTDAKRPGRRKGSMRLNILASIMPETKNASKDCYLGSKSR